MNYLIVLSILQTLSIGFLYYKLYSKPKSSFVRIQALPPGFSAKATPTPKPEPIPTPISKPFKRSSYDTPER